MGGAESLPEENLLKEFQRLNLDGFISAADTKVLINKFFQSGGLRPPPKDLVDTIIGELGDSPYSWQDIREHWALMRRSSYADEQEEARAKGSNNGTRPVQRDLPNSSTDNPLSWLDPEESISASYTESLGLANADGLPVGSRLAQGSMFRNFLEELERDMKQIRVSLKPPQPGAPSSILHQAVNYRGSHLPVSGHVRPREAPPAIVEGATPNPSGVLKRAAWLHDQVEDEIHALQGQLSLSSQFASSTPHHLLNPAGPGVADVQETLDLH